MSRCEKDYFAAADEQTLSSQRRTGATELARPAGEGAGAGCASGQATAAASAALLHIRTVQLRIEGQIFAILIGGEGK